MDDSRLWVASADWWTHAGAHIPWLRPDSQRVHIVNAGLEHEVARLLEPARYECVHLDGRSITDKETLIASTKRLLRLGEHCWAGWDSWRDCLSGLNDIWEGTDRLALLWSDSDVLMKRDLQTWIVAFEILSEASTCLQTKPRMQPGRTPAPDFMPRRLMVFEIFCFVDGFGARQLTRT